MPTIPIDNLDDPRVAPFRELRDRDLAQGGNRFIAEGEYLVRRLLESDFPCEALLVSDKRIERIAARVPQDVPMYVASHALVDQIIGFKFHSGILAIGRQKPSTTIDQLISGLGARERMTFVVCPQIINTHNLGSIIRICAALGADGLILGPQCCDPFYRKSVRISMGAVFRLPIVRSDDLARDMIRLRDAHGVQLIATLLDDTAELLPTAPREAHDRLAIVLGPEDTGLEPEFTQLCQRRVTIPMHYGTDSLNVGMAGALILYHFMNVASSLNPKRTELSITRAQSGLKQ